MSLSNNVANGGLDGGVRAFLLDAADPINGTAAIASLPYSGNETSVILGSKAGENGTLTRL
jgi:hypothetical protein